MVRLNGGCPQEEHDQCECALPKVTEALRNDDGGEPYHYRFSSCTT
jgi:hypothetical protein